MKRLILAVLLSGCASTGFEEASSERAVDAFVALCPVGADRAGFEAALNEAVLSGRVVRPDGEGEEILILRSHSPWPTARPITWDGMQLQLFWGDDARSCGLLEIDVRDSGAFNRAVARRLGESGEHRVDVLMPGVSFMTRDGAVEVGEKPHTIWARGEHDGQRDEIVSVQTGQGPTPGFITRDGITVEAVVDTRRQAILLRGRPASQER